MTNSWDTYYLGICQAVAEKSPCLSRKIGAILVKDKSIISTGYNGPARGVPHCGSKRYLRDKLLSSTPIIAYSLGIVDTGICPRKVMGFSSGEGMQWCTAQHAEENCISNAARNGTCVDGATLYLNTVIPCKNCFSTLINAGISEIVCIELTNYDEYSKFIIENSSIKLRTFNL